MAYSCGPRDHIY